MASFSSPQQGREALDQLTLLYSLADLIQRTRHAGVIFQEAVDGICRVLDVDRALVLVLEDGLMRCSAWAGVPEELRAGLEGFAPWPAGAREPRPVLVADLAGHDGEVGGPELDPVREALLSAGARSVACLPLLHRGQPLGELILLMQRPGGLTPAALRIVEVVAGHLALAMWRNRTDADQAELLRRFEAERSVLESVVSQMPAGVLLADAPSGRIVMSNAQVTTIWGKTLRHTAQISDYALWGGRDPQGNQLAPEQWPLARSVRHGETVDGEEVRIERADGSRAIIRMSSVPVVDSQGRQLAAVATVHDITAERAAEEERAFLQEAIRQLNASLEVGSTAQSLVGVLVPRYGDWCGVYLRREREDIERIAALGPEESRTRSLGVEDDECLSLSGEDPVARTIREGGEARVTRTAVTLPLIVRDRALGALAIGRSRSIFSPGDVRILEELAGRAAMALDNALLYEQARLADRAKANFLAVMSHEFRTPLSAILGYADILTAEVHGELNPKQRRHLDRVKASVRHLSHLVDEILSFASMEAGRERVRPERIEAVNLVGDVAGLMEPIAEAAGLALDVALPVPPVEMVTDPQKVRQILINLLSNAIKYTPEGQVRLGVEVTPGHLLCHVTDTGPGIAPDYVEAVFEPFWQVDRGDGRRVTGTGLGLSVARRLARLMGGDVRLRTALGEGSTFTLELPRFPLPGVAASPGS